MMTPAKAYAIGYRQAQNTDTYQPCPFNDYAADLLEAWGAGFVQAIADWMEEGKREFANLRLLMTPHAGSC